MIAGFPGETWETIDTTVAFLNHIEPTYFKISPFYYDHRAPVAQRASEFDLRGAGFNWSHATFDSQMSVDAVDYVRSNVRNSCWMPSDYYTFFALPYLRGKGLSNGQILRLTQALGTCVDVNRLANSTSLEARSARAKALSTLEATVRALPWEDARFALVEDSPLDAPSFRAVVDRVNADISGVLARATENVRTPEMPVENLGVASWAPMPT